MGHIPNYIHRGIVIGTDAAFFHLRFWWDSGFKWVQNGGFNHAFLYFGMVPLSRKIIRPPLTGSPVAMQPGKQVDAKIGEHHRPESDQGKPGNSPPPKPAYITGMQ